MKCILCNQRKGKRYCPAKGAMICAQCCGEKRILEIDCPESCEYLQIGRSHEAALENSRHLRPSDPIRQQMYSRVLRHFAGVISHLEYVVAQERHASRELTDDSVAEALGLLLKTYHTEEKGIIYENVSNNLKVDLLRRQLHDVVNSYRNPSDADQERLGLKDAMDCLGVIHDVVTSHMKARSGSSSYVDFLARTVPRASELERPGSLIIPG